MAEPIDVRERRELCDLLTELGPDAPTLCEGWTTLDLAAHLYLREHFKKWTDERMAAEKTKGLPALVDRLRGGRRALPVMRLDADPHVGNERSNQRHRRTPADSKKEPPPPSTQPRPRPARTRQTWHLLGDDGARLSASALRIRPEEATGSIPRRPRAAPPPRWRP